jgi:hypothetical protein
MTDQSIEDASRSEFEAWYEANAMPLESNWFDREKDGGYKLNFVENTWEGWQAARQSSQSEPVEDPLPFLKTHGAIDEEGFEYGLCKVKFDSAGKPTHVLWTDIETVIALKKRKGIV